MPSEYLTEHEIAAAAAADQGGVFNPQQQFRVGWGDEPVVARAYIDQLQRGEDVSVALAADLDAALERSAARIERGTRDAELAAELHTDSGNAVTQKRLESLAETLSGIAARLL